MTIRDRDIKKLEWAIWLSQVDLQTLRESDWIKVMEDLADFVKGSGALTNLDEGLAALHGLKSEQDWLCSVQKGLREHFEELVSMGTVNIMGVSQGSILSKPSAISVPINGRIQVEAFEGERYRLLTKTDTLTSQACSALASYLVSSGIVAGQIRKCPTCGRIFLVKRKPRGDVTFHCSLKCSRVTALSALKIPS